MAKPKRLQKRRHSSQAFPILSPLLRSPGASRKGLEFVSGSSSVSNLALTSTSTSVSTSGSLITTKRLKDSPSRPRLPVFETAPISRSLPALPFTPTILNSTDIMTKVFSNTRALPSTSASSSTSARTLAPSKSTAYADSQSAPSSNASYVTAPAYITSSSSLSSRLEISTRKLPQSTIIAETGRKDTLAANRQQSSPGTVLKSQSRSHRSQRRTPVKFVSTPTRPKSLSSAPSTSPIPFKESFIFRSKGRSHTPLGSVNGDIGGNGSQRSLSYFPNQSQHHSLFNKADNGNINRAIPQKRHPVHHKGYSQSSGRYSLSDLQLLSSPIMSASTGSSVSGSDTEDESCEKDLQSVGQSTPASENVVQGVVSPQYHYDPIQEPIKTYLRLRPVASDTVMQTRPLTQEMICGHIEIVNETEILMHPPVDLPKPRLKKPSRYRFSKVFGPRTRQADLFQQTCLPLLIPVLRQPNYNSLLFAYGTTNSGKTHSILGANGGSEAGVLPRALDVVFKSLEMHADTGEAEHYRPTGFQGLELVETAGMTMIGLASEKVQGATPTNIVEKEEERDFMEIDDGSTFIQLPKGVDFAVWISFAELYTDKIFDLLTLAPEQEARPFGVSGGIGSESMNTQQGRPRLSLKTDASSGHKYVDGLREVHVRSRDEAQKILQAGLLKRRVSSTAMNESSSRSHCVFTIKVIKVPQLGSTSAETTTNGRMSVSRLSIVDLAGSERARQTNNTGQRLKEAGKINSSLMVLGQCMEALRWNQRPNVKPQLVPFRHSKLTELFQCILEGKARNGDQPNSQVAMIVNVNSFETGFEENANVLKFSAVAMDVATLCLNGTKEHPSNFVKKAIKSDKTSKLFIGDKVNSPGKPVASSIRSSMLTDDENSETLAVDIAGRQVFDDRGMDQVTLLLMQVTDLKEKWLEADARCGSIESIAREEVYHEMSDLMQKREQEFAKQLQDQAIQAATQLAASASVTVDRRLTNRQQNELDLLMAKNKQLEEEVRKLSDNVRKLEADGQILENEFELMESALVEADEEKCRLMKEINAWEAWHASSPQASLALSSDVMVVASPISKNPSMPIKPLSAPTAHLPTPAMILQRKLTLTTAKPRPKPIKRSQLSNLQDESAQKQTLPSGKSNNLDRGTESSQLSVANDLSRPNNNFLAMDVDMNLEYSVLDTGPVSLAMATLSKEGMFEEKSVPQGASLFSLHKAAMQSYVTDLESPLDEQDAGDEGALEVVGDEVLAVGPATDLHMESPKWLSPPRIKDEFGEVPDRTERSMSCTVTPDRCHYEVVQAHSTFKAAITRGESVMSRTISPERSSIPVLTAADITSSPERDASIPKPVSFSLILPNRQPRMHTLLLEQQPLQDLGLEHLPAINASLPECSMNSTQGGNAQFRYLNLVEETASILPNGEPEIDKVILESRFEGNEENFKQTKDDHGHRSRSTTAELVATLNEIPFEDDDENTPNQPFGAIDQVVREKRSLSSDGVESDQQSTFELPVSAPQPLARLASSLSPPPSTYFAPAHKRAKVQTHIPESYSSMSPVASKVDDRDTRTVDMDMEHEFPDLEEIEDLDDQPEQQLDWCDVQPPQSLYDPLDEASMASVIASPLISLYPSLDNISPLPSARNSLSNTSDTGTVAQPPVLSSVQIDEALNSESQNPDNRRLSNMSQSLLEEEIDSDDSLEELEYMSQSAKERIALLPVKPLSRQHTSLPASPKSFLKTPASMVASPPALVSKTARLSPPPSHGTQVGWVEGNPHHSFTVAEEACTGDQSELLTSCVGSVSIKAEPAQTTTKGGGVTKQQPIETIDLADDSDEPWPWSMEEPDAQKDKMLDDSQNDKIGGSSMDTTEHPSEIASVATVKHAPVASTLVTNNVQDNIGNGSTKKKKRFLRAKPTVLEEEIDDNIRVESE